MRQPGTSLVKPPVGTAITAVVGLIVAALSLVVFVFDLLVTPEFGALIISFVVCGIGLTTGLTLLRHLAPPREPISLFAAPACVSAEPAPQNKMRAQAEELSPNCSQAAITMPQAKKADPITSSNRHRSISSYKARESSGALCFAIAIGVCLVLGGRLRGGWEFLFFAVPAGGLVALALYWIRQKQDPSLDAHTLPVAGGVIGFICMTGLGIVMIRSHLLRIFFGLAVGAGSAVALVLSWDRRRRQKSSSSLV
jgi:hypothetical protein